MANITVSPNDVWRTKKVTTGWNVYQTQADVTAGKVIAVLPGETLVGKFIRDVETARGGYALMELAIPMEVSTGVLGLTKVKLVQVWIQSGAIEKMTLFDVYVKKGSSQTGRINRRTGPSTEYPLISPPLIEGQKAGKSDGTEKNGYMVLFTEDGRVQFASKTYLTMVGQVEQSTIDSLANTAQTSTSIIDFPLLGKSILFGVGALLIGWSIGYLSENPPRFKRRTA